MTFYEVGQYYLIGLLVLSFTLIIGQLLTFLTNIKSQFFSLTIGLLTVTSLYAIIRTKGYSVMSFNILLIVIIGFLAKSRNKNNRSFLRFDKRFFFRVFLFFSIFFLMQLNILINIKSGAPKLIHLDLSFYAHLSGYLRDFGVENILIDYFNESKGVASPYHYLELWTGALISNLFQLKSKYSLVLITYPLLFTIVYQGLIEFIHTLKERYNSKIRFSDYLIAFIFFFFEFSRHLYPDFLGPLKFEFFAYSIFSTPKLSVIYIGLLASILFFLKKEYLFSTLSIVFLQINYVTLIPSTFIFSLILLVYYVFTKRSIRLPSVIIASALLIAFFYSFSDGKQSLLPTESQAISNLFNSEFINKSIGIIPLSALQFLLATSPFLLIYFLIQKHLDKRFILLCKLAFILIISSILSWSVTHFMQDSVQFWHNAYIPLASLIGLALVILLKYHLKKARIFIVYSFLSFLVFFQDFSFLNRVELDQFSHSFFSDIQDNSRFCYIRPTSEYTTFFSKFDHIYFGNTFTLAHHISPLQIACISSFNIPLNGYREKKLENLYVFNKFCNEERSLNKFESFKKAQLKFLSHFKVDFLMVRPNTKIDTHFLNYANFEYQCSIDNFEIYKINPK